MKCLIVLAFAAVAFAAPIEEKATPSPFELTHSLDADGTYSFTFSSEEASKTETRTKTGQIRGAYSYIDSEGVLQKVQYVADENGFQVYGTNLPVGSTVPVKETPEVLEATAQHFDLIDKHLKKIVIAKKLEEEYRLAHPELFEDKEEEVKIVKRVSIPIRVVERPVHVVGHVVEYDTELPVPPMDEEEVVIARASHLAEVARITKEHLDIVAKTPKWVDEE